MPQEVLTYSAADNDNLDVKTSELLIRLFGSDMMTRPIHDDELFRICAGFVTCFIPNCDVINV